MSRYTSDDPEVSYLNPEDRTNYEFDLLKYNVEENLEFTEGKNSLAFFSSPEKIVKQIKNPRQLSATIVTILAFVFIVTAAAFVVAWLYVNSRTDEEMKQTLNSTILYCVLLFGLLGIGFWFSNKILREMNMVGLLI